MDYRRLGKSGLKVSEFSFGAWVTFGKQVGEDAAASIMGYAYDHGVNFFDNAEGYEQGNAEVVMGEALRALNWPRDTYAVSSKVFWGGSKPTQGGLSRKHVTDAAHAALKRLQVDYLDLYFCHRPDIDTPIEETVWAMHNLIVQGKVLYWGTSEWSAADIATAWQVAERQHLHKPVMEQPEYNLFHRSRVEKEYAPLCDSIGLGLTTWSPLASGLLTGKYAKGVPADSRGAIPRMKFLVGDLTDARKNEIVAKLAGVANELGCSLAQLAIAWCAANPHVSTVITGASRVSQVTENMKAAAVIAKITPEVMARIDAIAGAAAA